MPWLFSRCLCGCFDASNLPDMAHQFRLPLLSALAFFSLFFALTQWRADQPELPKPSMPLDRVVISAPVLTALYGGDRFLAAGLETMRLAATGVDFGQTDTHYLVRAQRVVSELNPCHENNYYLANGLLTWGGATEDANEVLRRAMDCRWWDELPAFFYGFNKYFFDKNIKEAQAALRIAADRAGRNEAGYRKLAIMIEVEQIDDEKMALNLLKQERDKASGAKLIAMLDKRVKRLEGLLSLREAKRVYEERTGKALQHPEQLITTGILKTLPVDPMKLGYELKDGQFILKQVKVAGVEAR